MTLDISHPDIINNINPLFNEDDKSLITCNNPDTPNKGILRNQETDTKIP